MEKFSFNTSKFDGVKPNLVLETDFSKEICITMQKDSVMKEHKAPADITVQVLRGEIEFSVGDEVCNIKELEIIYLKANVAHSLKAIEDSIVRLTLSKNDNFSRVLKVKTSN